MQDILIVIDMQNDPIATLNAEEVETFVGDVRSKIEEYKNDERPVLFTRYTCRESENDQNYCVKDTDGHKIDSRIFKEEEHNNKSFMYVGNKHQLGLFNWFPIFNKISKVVSKFDVNNIKGIEICGLFTDTSIITNALILNTAFPEAKIEISGTLCAGTSAKKHKEALGIMKNCNIDITK